MSEDDRGPTDRVDESEHHIFSRDPDILTGVEGDPVGKERLALFPLRPGDPPPGFGLDQSREALKDRGDVVALDKLPCDLDDVTVIRESFCLGIYDKIAAFVHVIVFLLLEFTLCHELLHVHTKRLSIDLEPSEVIVSWLWAIDLGSAHDTMGSSLVV
jgi:hypothetical protein